MSLADVTWNSGLPKTVMDIGDLAAKFAAIAAGFIAVWKAVNEIAESRKQRALDLRWKQASAAREVLNEIHDDPRAMAATEMLDWGPGRHEYTHAADSEIKIGESDVVAALERPRSDAASKKAELIWKSFDWLFYHVDRLEHYVRTGLIEFEDVRDVFRHYVAEIEKHPQAFGNVIETQDYHLARAFLNRFREGRS